MDMGNGVTCSSTGGDTGKVDDGFEVFLEVIQGIHRERRSVAGRSHYQRQNRNQ